jgi:hypothetical protein
MVQLSEAATVTDDPDRRGEARRRQLAPLERNKWRPGQSGNPKGRTPEIHPDVKKLAKEFGPEALERLKFWARSADYRASIPACSILLERGHGKAGPADIAAPIPSGWEALTVAERVRALNARREALRAQEAAAMAPAT